MRISILVASCGRPTLFKTMLDSLYDTTQDYEIEIVFVIDENLETLQLAYQARELAGKVIDYSPIKRGSSWSWNRALQISTGEIFVMTGDDQIFHPNWLRFALESHELRLQGYGMVGLNDLAYDGNTQLATFWLTDKKYCKEQMGGVLCPPMYKHYCVDSEWNEKSKILGKFYWDERAKVEHLHSAHGKREVDELDNLKGNDKWMELDNNIFADRKAQGFPITWTSMI